MLILINNLRTEKRRNGWIYLQKKKKLAARLLKDSLTANGLRTQTLMQYIS